MWFTPLTSWLVALLTTGIPLANEKIGQALEPEVPAENWANRDLYYKDMVAGMSAEERMRNLHKGRYRFSMQYLEPHRDPVDNKIIIENEELYWEDSSLHGSPLTHKWLEQGKYNLNEDELKLARLQSQKKEILMYRGINTNNPKEDARLREITRILANAKWDYKNTEAVKYWNQANIKNGIKYNP